MEFYLVKIMALFLGVENPVPIRIGAVVLGKIIYEIVIYAEIPILGTVINKSAYLSTKINKICVSIRNTGSYHNIEKSKHCG